jgi:general L-amino acid transport system permease protein
MTRAATTARPATATSRFRLSWRDPRCRAVVWQIAVLATIGAILAAIAMQTAVNLERRGIASGFGFLRRTAGFEIAQGPLAYSSRDTYARALELGLINTLRVSLLGILLAAGLGLAIGVARLSSIWAVSTLSKAYVEALRNTPLLLQLLFWYALWQTLPGPREALNPLPGVFLCVRGLMLPGLAWHDGALRLDRPTLTGFNFHGGLTISPEFAALLIGLTTFTAAFIGEIVRGGILAVDKGQAEAGAALGLSRGRVLRLVILPQALRVIIPPTASQFLNLAKNSSLAVAIGYPDLMSISDTTANQTGQAIEGITLALLVYLAISLVISAAMHLCERLVARRGPGMREGRP